MDPVLKLRRLSGRDAEEERLRRAAAARLTVSERLSQALELSDAARELAGSVRATWLTPPWGDLSDKAERYPRLR